MNFFKALPLFLVFTLSNLALAHENKVDTIVLQALEEFHVPGAAVAVVVGGKIIHCQGY